MAAETWSNLLEKWFDHVFWARTDPTFWGFGPMGEVPRRLGRCSEQAPIVYELFSKITINIRDNVLKSNRALLATVPVPLL